MMNNLKYLLVLVCITLLYSCKEGQKLESKDGFAVVPAPKKGESVATFSGGCFWAMQECMIELKGVNKVISGYAGGTTKNPSYDDVTSQTTGHAESVQVYYDPSVITYDQLVNAFFHAHDSTQENGQGPDIGSDYRSIAFYRNAAERETIEKVITMVNSDGAYQHPVVTETLPFTVFYGAESNHQDYYKRNVWEPYIRNVSKPKVIKLRKALPGLIKSNYLD
ncbi:MAG: peptide-methionine (S)-S-oxide reductase MsrA [Bacteroidota bacterium]